MHAEGSNDGSANVDQISPTPLHDAHHIQRWPTCFIFSALLECTNVMNEVSTAVDLLAAEAPVPLMY